MKTYRIWLQIDELENGDFISDVQQVDLGDFEKLEEAKKEYSKIVNFSLCGDDLLEACKDGIKFLDSLIAGNNKSKTQLKMLSENRTAFRKILNAAIAKTQAGP